MVKDLVYCVDDHLVFEVVVGGVITTKTFQRLNRQ